MDSRGNSRAEAGPVTATGARAGGQRLENIANKPTPPLADARRIDRRTARYELRRTLWEVSDLPRLRNCGRARTGSHVGVRSSAGSSGFSGLQSCGSVWSCPVCSAKVAARRSLEIGCGLLAWERMGGRLLMGTLTMRHHRGHRLEAEWDALTDSWNSILKSKVWARWKTRLGMVGNLRVVEVTDGDNGWHAHLHLVLLVGGAVAEDPELVDEFTTWLLGKWSRALERHGFPGALDLGQDVHLVDGVTAAEDMGKYLSKASPYETGEAIGRELLGSWTKGARGEWGTVPAWRIAEHFKATGDADALDRWHEYERVSKGRRQVTWSRGLRDLLGIGQDLSDEAVAAEEIGTVDLLRLDKHAWSMVLAQSWPTSRLLDVLDRKGLAGLCAFLDANGILYTLTDEGVSNDRLRCVRDGDLDVDGSAGSARPRPGGEPQGGSPGDPDDGPLGCRLRLPGL